MTVSPAAGLANGATGTAAGNQSEASSGSHRIQPELVWVLSGDGGLGERSEKAAEVQ